MLIGCISWLVIRLFSWKLVFFYLHKCWNFKCSVADNHAKFDKLTVCKIDKKCQNRGIKKLGFSLGCIQNAKWVLKYFVTIPKFFKWSGHSWNNSETFLTNFRRKKNPIKLQYFVIILNFVWTFISHNFERKKCIYKKYLK